MGSDKKNYLIIDDLQERSITLTPATRKMSLVQKSERIPMNEAIKKAIKKAGLSEAGEAGITAILGELDKVKADLGPMFDKVTSAMASALNGDAEKMAEKVEATTALIEKAKEQDAVLKKALTALDKEEPSVGEAADALAKALNTEREVKHADELPAHLQAKIDAAVKKAEQAEDRIIKAEAKVARAETITKCKADFGNVPMDADGMADMLIGMSKDARKSCTEMLGKVNGIMAKSEALQEIGHTGADGGAGPLAKLKAIAKNYQESNPDLNPNAALLKAQRNNPDLRKQYDMEQRGN